jgi:hypothetical protein
MRRALVAFLHVAQPLVRLEGRLRHGLTPWRRFAKPGRALPVPRRFERWSEQWVDPVEWVRTLERGISADGGVVRRGGEFDSWDIETRCGVLAGVRVTTTVEEHGSGKQLVRGRCRPVFSRLAVALTLVLLGLAAGAAASQAPIAAIPMAAIALALGARILAEASAALTLTADVLTVGGTPREGGGREPGGAIE